MKKIINVLKLINDETMLFAANNSFSHLQFCEWRGDIRALKQDILCSSISCHLHYLRRHVLTDGLDLYFDISNQQVELILHKLQPVHLILSVLQCCHSEAPPQQQEIKSQMLTYS